MSAQVSFEGARPGIRFPAYSAQIGSAIVLGGDAARGTRSCTYANRVFTPELQPATTMMRLRVRMGMADQTAIGRRALIHSRGRLRRRLDRIAILRGGT